METWVGEAADFDSDPGVVGVSRIVNRRTAHGAEMKRASRAGAVAIRDRRRALDGKTSRHAFHGDTLCNAIKLVAWSSCYRQHTPY